MIAAASECNSCRNLRSNNECVSSCPVNAYASANGTCMPCHSECVGCFGPSDSECAACRHAVDGVQCVPVCPVGKYAAVGGVCATCNAQCLTSAGCTGPRDIDCAVCAAFGRNVSGEVQCVAQCASVEYANIVTSTCVACNAECLDGCNGTTASDCVGRCAHFKLGSQCVRSELLRVHTHILCYSYNN